MTRVSWLAALVALALPFVSTSVANAAPNLTNVARGLERPSIMQAEDAIHSHAPLRLAPQLQQGPTRSGAQAAAPAPQTPGNYNRSGLRREVFGFATYWELASGDLNDVQYDKVSTFAYFGLTVNGGGGFDNDSGMTGWNSNAMTNLVNNAHGAGDRVVLVAKQFGQGAICSIVGSSAGQAAINNIITAVRARGLDGVNVDFEGSAGPCAGQSNVQTLFTSWIASLSSQLRAQVPGAQLTVDSYSGAASWSDGFFRIDTLAPYVDAFFIMAYDMNSPQDLPNAPLAGPYTYYDTRSVDQYLTRANGDGSKVILGVPYYGYKFSTTSNGWNASQNANDQGTCNWNCPDMYSDIAWEVSTCGAQQLSRNWDSASSTPWASWWSPASGDPCNGNHNSWREVYYDDVSSLGAKYDLVNSRDIRGMGMWALGYDHGSGLWPAIASHFVARWSGWAEIGSAITGQVAVAANSDGRLEAFARGIDGEMWHAWETAPGGSWSGWAPLGWSFSGPPTVAVNQDGRLEIFALGTDGEIWHAWEAAPSGGWSGWAALGWTMAGRPAAARNSDGRLELFSRIPGGSLWHAWQQSPGGAWSGWAGLGAALGDDPSVIANQDGRLEVMAQSAGGPLIHAAQLSPAGATWSGWSGMGWPMIGRPALAMNSDGRLEAFERISNRAAWHSWQTSPGGTWSGWAFLDAGTVSDMSAARNLDGRLEVFALTSDGSVSHRWQTSPGGGWTSWGSLGWMMFENPTAAAEQDGRLMVFDSNNHPGIAWRAWQLAPGGG